MRRPKGCADCREVAALVWERFGEQPVGVVDLWGVVVGSTIDLDLGDGNERALRIRLGRMIGTLRDRHYAIEEGAVRVAGAGTVKKIQRWRLVPAP